MIPDVQAQYPVIAVALKHGASVIIRPLTTADGEALAECYADIPREHIRFYCPHLLDREHALLNASRAESPTELVLVAEMPDGRIAGYAWARWSTPDDANSTFGICIRPSYQDAGLGRALITRLLEIGGAVGPPGMALTVQHANARAVRLYTSMGFVPIREQTRQADPAEGFTEEPEYYMERVMR